MYKPVDDTYSKRGGFSLLMNHTVHDKIEDMYIVKWLKRVVEYSISVINKSFDSLISPIYWMDASVSITHSLDPKLMFVGSKLQVRELVKGFNWLFRFVTRP